MAALKKIESDLLKLPLKTRLAVRLIESLEDDPDAEWKKAWLAEAARRGSIVP